jgi:uncharacterized small protein (DUF1192 family)
MRRKKGKSRTRRMCRLLRRWMHLTRREEMDPLKALFDALDALKSQLSDADALLKSEYARGFADGVASVSVDPEKKYSQADVDAAVSAAVAPLNEQIAALQAQVDSFDAKIKAALEGEDQRILDLISKEIADLVAGIKPVVVEPPPVEPAPEEPKPEA